jgi:uncharacterized protein (DUF1697 family)
VPEYAAFLRGINVGSHHRISGDELCARFEEMGFEAVTTFRASGNVLFAGGGEPLATTAVRIQERLAESLGYEVAVFLRTASEVRVIADHRPFARPLIDASKGKLQVAMLGAQPGTRAQEDVLALTTDQDRLAFGARELYWLPSAGTQESVLDLKVIGELLGAMTMRTKGTVEQMAAKYFAD